MPLVSFREYARMQGVSLHAIQDRIKRGSITERAIDRTGTRPKIISEVADSDFSNRQSAIGLEVKALQQKPKPPPLPKKDLISEMFDDTPSVLENKLPPLPKTEIVKEEIEGQEVDVQKLPYAGDDNFDRYRKAKAGTEELKARKLELEVAELEERLLDKEQVKRTIEKLVTVTREALLNLPGKIAPEVLAINDLVELETKLYAEINQALENLAKVREHFHD